MSLSKTDGFLGTAKWSWSNMRLPLLVANAIRERHLIAPGGRVLVALSGGPDSVALLLCMLELSKKRYLHFHISAGDLKDFLGVIA